MKVIPNYSIAFNYPVLSEDGTHRYEVLRPWIVYDLPDRTAKPLLESGALITAEEHEQHKAEDKARAMVCEHQAKKLRRLLGRLGIELSVHCGDVDQGAAMRVVHKGKVIFDQAITDFEL